MTDLYLMFIKLDLIPGCSVETVNARYRILASLLHPDQMTGEQKKANADLEMKALNNRRDLIVAHLKSATHRAVGPCECRPPIASTVSANDAASEAKARYTNAPKSAGAVNRSNTGYSASGARTTDRTGDSNAANHTGGTNPTNDAGTPNNSKQTGHAENINTSPRSTPDLATAGHDPLRRARLIKTGRWPKDAKPGYETSPKSLDRHPDYPAEEI